MIGWPLIADFWPAELRRSHKISSAFLLISVRMNFWSVLDVNHLGRFHGPVKLGRHFLYGGN